jgi:carbon monoxide dehydrogenase subunit G
MQLSGQHELELDKNTVWNEINNHEMLRQCIPGCEKLELVGDNQFEMTILAKVGPIKTRFNGKMSMQDIQAPNSYKLVGSGSGGSAGSAKGETLITLKDVEGNKTILNYEASVSVNGKLAQIGSKLIDGTSKSFASQFFENFVEAVKNKSANTENDIDVKTESEQQAFSVDLIPAGQSKIIIVSIVILALIAGLIFLF